MNSEEWGLKISRKTYDANTPLTEFNKRFFQLLSTDGCLLKKELSSNSSNTKKFTGYIVMPDPSITSPYGGSYYYFGSIREIAIVNGGSGYTQGDYVNVVGGNSDARIYVSAVNASGVVTDCFVNMSGSGYEEGVGVSTTGGTGSGFTINIVSVTEDEPSIARPLNFTSGEKTYLIFENPL